MSHPERHDFFRWPELAAFNVSRGELDLRQGICYLLKKKIFPPLDVFPRHTIMATGRATGRTSIAVGHALHHGYLPARRDRPQGDYVWTINTTDDRPGKPLTPVHTPS
jgi:hypothetical protein